MNFNNSMASKKILDENVEDINKYDNCFEDHSHLSQEQKDYKLSQLNEEQNWSFFNYTPENLSISQSTMEQGFNKQSIMFKKFFNRNTLLYICTISLALSCIIFEIIKLPKIVENSRNIDMIKRDLELLRQQLNDRDIEGIWSIDNSEDYGNNDYDDEDYESDGIRAHLKNQKINQNIAINESQINQINETSGTKSRRKRKIDFHDEYIVDDEDIINTSDSSYSSSENEKSISEHQFHKDLERVKRSLASRESRTKNLRTSRQLYAAHFEADSHLLKYEDEHTGNGKFRHNQGVFKAWRPSDWMNTFGMKQHFSLNDDGQLIIQETGLYLIYAQIHYLDEHDENGFRVLVNEQPIFQCMVYSPGSGHKSRSCFSAQATYLQRNDQVMLKDIGVSRYTLFQKEKSFFGLFKIGDIKHTQVHSTQSPETES